MRCSSENRWKMLDDEQKEKSRVFSNISRRTSRCVAHFSKTLAAIPSCLLSRFEHQPEPDWPTTATRCIPGIRRACNRDDFYDLDPLTSSPTPIPSGVLCGDNSSLSYIVAVSSARLHACARLSRRMHLRFGAAYTRRNVFSFLFVTLDRIAK